MVCCMPPVRICCPGCLCACILWLLLGVKPAAFPTCVLNDVRMREQVSSSGIPSQVRTDVHNNLQVRSALSHWFEEWNREMSCHPLGLRWLPFVQRFFEVFYPMIIWRSMNLELPSPTFFGCPITVIFCGFTAYQNCTQLVIFPLPCRYTLHPSLS